jgi:hypothetical protein
MALNLPHLLPGQKIGRATAIVIVHFTRGRGPTCNPALADATVSTCWDNVTCDQCLRLKAARERAYD